MRFPYLLEFWGLILPPHPVFELLGWLTGLCILLWTRRRYGDPIARTARWSVGGAAAIGGALGSRLLSLPNGKTIVGGLLGGLVAVECVKKLIGVRTATGDLFALPLAVGIAIGRIGCFLTGISDHTYGNPTTLFTGVDFGDGVRRHPTQLYEAAFLVALALVITWSRARLTREGDRFKLFMVAYLAFRLLIDFIKPEYIIIAGVSLIQLACIAALLYYAPHLQRLARSLRSSDLAPAG